MSREPRLVNEVAKVMMWQTYHYDGRRRGDDLSSMTRLWQGSDPWERRLCRRQAKQLIDMLAAADVALVDERALPPAKVEDLR
jgi:hypothetical protein